MIPSSLTLLSNARTQFIDANGEPLASGTVGFYIPGTLTAKDTWQDTTGITANTNPIALDDLGSAAIWGNGFYRQILKDQKGNTLWDAETLSPGSGASHIADITAFGVSTSSPDNSVAMQAIIDNPDISVLWCPPGTYIFGTPGIRMKDNLSVYGAGKGSTIFKQKAGVNELGPVMGDKIVANLFQGTANLRIDGISFEGNGNPLELANDSAAMLQSYKATQWYISNCEFYNGRGYGVGLEGNKVSTDPSKQGPNTDILWEFCEFYNNGLASYLNPGQDTSDGIDAKSSINMRFFSCSAYGNGDKGFDTHGQKLIYEQCYAHDNLTQGFNCGINGNEPNTEGTATFIGCYAYNNSLNGYGIDPNIQNTTTGCTLSVMYTGCYASNNMHNWGIQSPGIDTTSPVTINISGCISENPATGTRHFFGGSAPAASININGTTMSGGTAGAIVINTNQTGPTNIVGCVFNNITGPAISFPAASTTAINNLSGNTFHILSSIVASGNSNLTASGNVYNGVVGTIPYTFTGSNIRIYDRPIATRTLTSATALTLNQNCNYFIVAGTTDITSIVSVDSYTGRQIILQFSGVLTVHDGSNLVLAGDFTTSSNDILSLIFNGTNWIETSRSTN